MEGAFACVSTCLGRHHEGRTEVAGFKHRTVDGGESDYSNQRDEIELAMSRSCMLSTRLSGEN